MANPYTAEQKQLSQESIQTALFVLMKQSKFADISISELAKKAGISRMGFYRNYASKEAVLADYFDRHISDFFKQLNKFPSKSALENGIRYFEYVKQNRELFQVLIDSEAETILIKKFSFYVSKFYSDNVKSVPFTGAYAHYWNSFVSAGLYNMTIAWIKNDCAEPVSLLAELAVKLAG